MASPRKRLEKQIGVAISPLISERLNTLVQIARAGAHRTTRRELAAALIDHESGAEELRAAIVKLRRASIADVLTELDRRFAASSNRMLGLTEQNPGPPDHEEEYGNIAAYQTILVGNIDAPLPRETIRVSLAVEPRIDAKLDTWLVRLRRIGERSTRSEILSALILVAPETGDELGELLRQYRIRSERRSS